MSSDGTSKTVVSVISGCARIVAMFILCWPVAVIMLLLMPVLAVIGLFMHFRELKGKRA